MLEEQGKVVRVDSHALWVETLQASTCGACRARSGCGQKALAGVLQTSSLLRILLDGHPSHQFYPGQAVTIGIPENVVVLGSLAVYMVPLLAMLGAAGVASGFGAGELPAVFAGIAGLLAGSGTVRYFSWRSRDNPAFQPVLLGPVL